MLGFYAPAARPLADRPDRVVRLRGRGFLASHMLFVQARAQLFAAGGHSRPGAAVLAGASAIQANWDFRVYAATRDFTSRPSDTPGQRLFAGTLRVPLSFRRSILGGRQVFRLTQGYGELVLDNTDGGYDYLVAGYALDGRPVTLKLGDPAGGYDGFATIFDGTAAGFTVSRRELRVRLRDRAYLLATPVCAATYPGGGGVDGTDAVKGKRIPRTLGHCLHVRPALIDPAYGLLQVNDGPVAEIYRLFDRLREKPFDQDYATPADLLAASIPSDHFATCNAAGLARTTDIDGTITCHVKGDKTGGVYVDTTAGIVRRLVTAPGLLRDPAQLATGSFDQLDADQPAEVGIAFALDDDTEVGAAVERLMEPIGGWPAFRRTGLFEVRRFARPGGTPAAFYDELDVLEIDQVRRPRAIDPPPWRVRMGYARFWTTQTSDIAAAVSDADRQRAAQARLIAESAPDPAIKQNHPNAQDPEPLEGFFLSAAAAQAEADRQFALWKDHPPIYRIRLKTQPYSRELGDVIALRYPRWDLGQGRLLAIVGADDDGERSEVEIEAIG